MDKETIKELSKEIDDFIKEAKINRKNFLKPYKEKFEMAITKKERAEIIIELIQLEPSHLSETWILSEVIEWLRRYDCIDYLKEAFISKGKRKRPTEREKAKDLLDELLVRLVDYRYNKAKGKISKDRIFADLTLRSEDNIFLSLNEKIDGKSMDYDLQSIYKKRYYSYKNKEKERKEEERKSGLPYPYYGFDVSIDRGVLDMMFHRK